MTILPKQTLKQFFLTFNSEISNSLYISQDIIRLYVDATTTKTTLIWCFISFSKNLIINKTLFYIILKFDNW